MNNAVKTMLARYACHSVQDTINALKEIIQEMALLGLWRARFYEHAAFYGGTALRVLYGLDRFSEDLDFSLLSPDPGFNLKPYIQSIKDELQGFGLSVEVNQKIKSTETQIQSAFIKAGTYQQLLEIETPETLLRQVHSQQVIKIKLEVDIDPPPYFQTEAKYLLLPIPFSVKTYQLPDLFAGKLHAVLCRQWQTRVKGRDWYDLVWHLSRQTPVRLAHLQARLIQSGHWDAKEQITRDRLKAMLHQRIDQIELAAAKKDICLFVADPSTLEVWSKDFFKAIIENIQVI